MDPLPSRNRVLLLVAVLMALIASGCAGNGEDAARGPTQEEDTWGPLAVMTARQFLGQARISGSVLITEGCVLLEENDQEVLLVWLAQRTAWDGESRTITFENEDGETVSVVDDQEVSFGGGSSSVAVGAAPSEQWVEEVQWASRPSSSCLRDKRWIVNAVIEPSEDS